jgi:hypothetical protein
MIFSIFDFTMDQKSLDGNKEQSFAPLPPEPNGRNKIMGAHDRIPPDLANSSHRCTVTFASGASRNYPLRPDKKEPTSERSPSSYKRNSRSTTLLGRSVDPRRRPVDHISGYSPGPSSDRSHGTTKQAHGVLAAKPSMDIHGAIKI